MSRKLFVANFPYSAGEESLRELFGRYGEVEEIKIIYDRETGRSRGFGFVMMETEAECVQAAEALNGSDLGGRGRNASRWRGRRGDARASRPGPNPPARRLTR